MRLTDLEPQFHRYETREGREHIIKVASLQDAQGVQFDCPKCRPYPHGIIVTFRDRGAHDHQGSQSRHGGPSRWAVSGSDFANLTLTPSIDCSQDGGCTFHGFIKNGEVS